MSDTITLGKRRKDGTWIVLVQPDKPFGDHLDVYRKIASKHPINDEFSKVIMGKLNHSSPALVLISTEDNAARIKQNEEREKSIKDIVESASSRQAEMNNQLALNKQEEHDEAIAEKNELIKGIRKATGQAVSAPPAKAKKNKYLDEYKDATKEELEMIQSSSAELKTEDGKHMNEAATELLKKFN